jgi:hypothetical protein
VTSLFFRKLPRQGDTSKGELLAIMRSSSTGPVVNAIFALAGSLIVTCVAMFIPPLVELLMSGVPTDHVLDGICIHSISRHDERPLPELKQGMFDLLFGVHHKETIPGNRLTQRLP